MEDNLIKTIPLSEHYSVITPNIALGNSNSSYEPFDVVINMTYPGNNAQRNNIHAETIQNKIIVRIGIYDNPDENIGPIIDNIIPKLIIHTKLNPNHFILFQCNTGISRSATILIGYLSVLWNLPYRKIIDFIKERRKIVNPNHGFMTALSEYLKK